MADKRKVQTGQRVKTFNGSTATIRREDTTALQRFAGDVHGILTGSGVKTPHRSAWAEPNRGLRTGIRGTETHNPRETRLVMVRRSDRSRNFQRVGQGLFGGALGGGLAHIAGGSRGKTALGAAAGATALQVFRPADRKLQFEEPLHAPKTKKGKVRKGSFVPVEKGLHPKVKDFLHGADPFQLEPLRGKAGAAGAVTSIGAGVGLAHAAAKRREKKIRAKVLEELGQKPVAKRGEWKTIDQRERSQVRARKTQRRGEAAIGTGAGLGYAAHLMPNKMYASTKQRVNPFQQAKHILNVAREKESKYDFAGDGKHGFTIPHTRVDRLKRTGSAMGKLPAGAMILGAGGLIGAGAVGVTQGKLREGYHQRKINERRKSAKRNVGFTKADDQRAPFDHESSGFARYGNGSSKGRKQDEFAMVSKRERNYDYELNRQRRLGAGIALAGAAGLGVGGHGLLRAAKTTAKVRRVPLNPGVDFTKLPKDVQAVLRQKKTGGFSATYGQAGQVAAGAGLGGASLGMGGYARGKRNKHWE